MAFIFGFGQSEIDTAIKIINECYDAAKNSDNVVTAINGVEKSYKAVDEKYGKMDKSEVPERYTYFFSHVFNVTDSGYYVSFTMHHINRRHAMSPDGWALWATDWMLKVSEHSGKQIFREVA